GAGAPRASLTGRAAEVRRDLVPLPAALFLITRDAFAALRGDRRHLEELGDELALIAVEPGAAVLAQVHQRGIALVEVAARLAQLGPHEPALCRARRQETAGHRVLAALVVDDVPGAELAQREETRAGDELALVRAMRRDEGAHRQAREVVARQESFAGEV